MPARSQTVGRELRRSREARGGVQADLVVFMAMTLGQPFGNAHEAGVIPSDICESRAVRRPAGYWPLARTHSDYDTQINCRDFQETQIIRPCKAHSVTKK